LHSQQDIWDSELNASVHSFESTINPEDHFEVTAHMIENFRNQRQLSEKLFRLISQIIEILNGSNGKLSKCQTDYIHHICIYIYLFCIYTTPVYSTYIQTTQSTARGNKLDSELTHKGGHGELAVFISMA
jgi:hypothetical protein